MAIKKQARKTDSELLATSRKALQRLVEADMGNETAALSHRRLIEKLEKRSKSNG